MLLGITVEQGTGAYHEGDDRQDALAVPQYGGSTACPAAGLEPQDRRMRDGRGHSSRALPGRLAQEALAGYRAASTTPRGRATASVLPASTATGSFAVRSTRLAATGAAILPTSGHQPVGRQRQGDRGDLTEIYYFKFKDPRGQASQRVYAGDRSRNQALVTQDNDIALVPAVYHPMYTA